MANRKAALVCTASECRNKKLPLEGRGSAPATVWMNLMLNERTNHRGTHTSTSEFYMPVLNVQNMFGFVFSTFIVILSVWKLKYLYRIQKTATV